MFVPTHTRRALAAFALGIALLTLASTVGGFHLDDDVYRYEAAEVSYDGELQITDPETGQRLTNVDPTTEIACDRRFDTRTCVFERYLARTNASVTGRPRPTAEYDYVLLNRFYRIDSTEVESGNRHRLTLTPVLPETALSGAARSVANAQPAVQRAVNTGKVVVYYRIAPERRFVEQDGMYYVVYLTGFRDHGRDAAWSSANCIERGPEFCEWAGVRRTVSSLLTLGMLFAGVVSIGFGVRRVLLGPAKMP